MSTYEVEIEEIDPASEGSWGTEPVSHEATPELDALSEAELDARRVELGVLDELKEIDGITPSMLVALGEAGIKSVEDLEALAMHEGVAVEDSTEPGGGKILRLIDPDGYRIEVVAGQANDEPSFPLIGEAFNTPAAKPRLNREVRLTPAPSHPHRIGHTGLADQRLGQALRVVGVVKAVAALDAQAVVVGRAIAPVHTDDHVVLDVVGQQATDTTERAD